jgi:hypothetical protein
MCGCRFVLTDSGVHWVWKLDEVADGEGEEEEDVLKTDAAWAIDRACQHGSLVSISSNLSVCERDFDAVHPLVCASEGGRAREREREGGREGGKEGERYRPATLLALTTRTTRDTKR